MASKSFPALPISHTAAEAADNHLNGHHDGEEPLLFSSDTTSPLFSFLFLSASSKSSCGVLVLSSYSHTLLNSWRLSAMTAARQWTSQGHEAAPCCNTARRTTRKASSFHGQACRDIHRAFAACLTDHRAYRSWAEVQQCRLTELCNCVGSKSEDKSRDICHHHGLEVLPVVHDLSANVPIPQSLLLHSSSHQLQITNHQTPVTGRP